VVFVILFTIGTYGVRGWYGGKSVYETPLKIHVIVAAITSVPTIYLILRHRLKITGCVKCKVFANVREEIGRTYVRDEESY
ncbi:MAG TPA: hypothetical protein VLM78_02255, partial [Anaerolineales bacterium]|nr:hypothetical protein [Anaerolineales bacterium]